MAKVSVIVPVYKVEQYLNRCVESILNQTYKDLELILVDDGSPDKCGEICDKFVEQDSRVKCIHKKMGGVSAARNTGIRMATGEYICFVDSDDYISEDYLLEFAKEIDKNAVEIIICGYTEIKGKNKIERNFYDLDLGNIRRNIVLRSWAPAAWNKCYKKELFKDELFPVGQTMEDLFLIPSLLLKTDKISCINKALYYYDRNNSCSIMNTMNTLKEYDNFLSYIRLIKLADKINVSSEEKEALIMETLKIGRKCLYHNYMQKMLNKEQCENVKVFLRENINHIRGNFYKKIMEKFLIEQLLSGNDFVCKIIAKIKR